MSEQPPDKEEQLRRAKFLLNLLEDDYPGNQPLPKPKRKWWEFWKPKAQTGSTTQP